MLTCLLMLSTVTLFLPAAADELEEHPMMRLRVSDNGHFLVQEDGSPLFPVADTAWEIAWRLNRVQVERYVQCRSDQGFNTLAMVAFSEDEGGIPNPYGKHPFAV